MDAMAYKCKKCNDLTPHWYVQIKGTWKWNNKTIGYLEAYKCLKCGNTKTIRRGRGEWSQSVLSA
jgi:DNA-directed RNA polymerase subunit RPC12/RpoP